MEGLIAVVWSLLIAFAGSSAVPKSEEEEALFLTPLIEDGRIREAQIRSCVTGFGDSVKSYSGYLTVNETYNSNMFFWFFPAESDPENAPLLLWLNGGPGVPSLIGQFLENGPLAYVGKGKVERREFAWTKEFSMLYIDSPVGTGYSFTDDEAGMSNTIEDVTTNLYSALSQFFKLFPMFLSNDFYIGGQSYAGKYVPALGKYVHDRNHDASMAPEDRINFKGIYVGGAFCDPPTMLPVFADTLFFDGMITEHERQSYKANITAMFQRALKANIMDLWDLFQTVYSLPPKILPVGLCMDNILGCEATNTEFKWDMEGAVLTSERFRNALHVGAEPLKNPKGHMSMVLDHLAPDDFIRNTNSENAFLMENYKVLHYSGNLDVVVSVPMSEAFLSKVQWSGNEQYQLTNRRPWFVDDKLVGWYSSIGNFSRVIVRNAGHMVPYDQPSSALDMMKKFIHDQPFTTQP